MASNLSTTLKSTLTKLGAGRFRPMAHAIIQPSSIARDAGPNAGPNRTARTNHAMEPGVLVSKSPFG